MGWCTPGTHSRDPSHTGRGREEKKERKRERERNKEDRGIQLLLLGGGFFFFFFFFGKLCSRRPRNMKRPCLLGCTRRISDIRRTVVPLQPPRPKRQVTGDGPPHASGERLLLEFRRQYSVPNSIFLAFAPFRSLCGNQYKRQEVEACAPRVLRPSGEPVQGVGDSGFVGQSQ